MQRPTLSLVTALALVAACAPHEPGAFWRPGARYRLILAADGPRTLTPEQARYLAPVSDTAALQLTVDSVARDTAYGRVDGDTRHFPVAFRAVGGDRFIATRERERWRLTVNPHAADTGLALAGERSGGELRGGWETRFPSGGRGRFVLAPAT